MVFGNRAPRRFLRGEGASEGGKAVGLGYTNGKHMSAGISDWKSAGEKVEKADANAR